MTKQIKILLLFFLIFLNPKLVFSETKEIKIESNNINYLIETEIKDQFSYSGLAAYFNKIQIYILDANDIKRLKDQELYLLKSNQSLAIVGRHKIMVIKNANLHFSFFEEKLIWHKNKDNKGKFDLNNLKIQILLKSNLVNINKTYEKLKYSHLSKPFRVLCMGIEALLLWLNSLHVLGWGITIILFSFLFKIFILPVNIFLIHVQRKVSKIQISLMPELENIKSKFSGEEAHHKFILAHKARGITPYYKLKPLFLTLIPIPFLVAIFNVIGELDQISGHSFLWIKDIAYPDNIFEISFYIPFLGDEINLLPILMFIISILSSIGYRNKIISIKELNKQKLNLYLMSFVFLLLFYPFPSAMVLYWTFSNIWSAIQQKLIQI